MDFCAAVHLMSYNLSMSAFKGAFQYILLMGPSLFYRAEKCSLN